MLQFKQSDTSASIILTLTEFATISGPHYLMSFTHVLTREVVSFVLPAEESLFPARYNKFTINPSVLFTGKQPGEWHYEVREQASDSNTDISLSGSIVEYGKLMLDRETDFAFKKRQKRLP
jgi:hypothetical protein